MKEVKNAENNETKEVEEVVKEPKLKKFGSKVATTLKKNGKKIVAGIAAIGAAGLIGYGIGKYKSDEDSDFYDETDENLESTEDETDEVEEV